MAHQSPHLVSSVASPSAPPTAPAPYSGIPGGIHSIRATGLTKRYGHHRALASVDLELRAGSLCALLGPNGAGKSTLLGILSTLVRPTAGQVAYLGASGREPDARELRRHIGVLAHSSFIYGELTGMENLLFYAKLYSVAQAREQAQSLLEQVGLDPKAWDRAARTYSRGMLQRVALARALLHQPSILLLDEPFTGLDRTGSEALARVLAEARTGGRIVLVVTHDFESIAGFTDHVVVLRRGKIAHEERYARPSGLGAGQPENQTNGQAEPRGFSYEELKTIYHSHIE